MTTALVRQELGRPKLEALVFGHAIAAAAYGNVQLAGDFLEALDPERISSALRQLLEQVSSSARVDDVLADTKAQCALDERARAIALDEYLGVGAFSFDCLVALCNQLPPVRAMPTPAWQRQLAEGLAT